MDSTLHRFFQKVAPLENDCWEWMGNKNRGGYGNFYLPKFSKKKSGYVLAHRASLILHGVKLMNRMVVDHSCRKRDCVNPNHLRQVTHRENTTKNSLSIMARNRNKTHCERGHLLAGKNIYTKIYISASGKKWPHRICVTCYKASAEKHRNKPIVALKQAYKIINKIGFGNWPKENPNGLFEEANEWIHGIGRKYK